MAHQDKSAFVPSRLPWLIAAAALVLYLLTLNRWASLSSLPNLARAADAQLVPAFTQPLHFLLFLPFRWLHPSWQPFALNAFSALCAALTLGLLARTVALLPHDRTREQRQRERNEFGLLTIPTAWAPPLLAALACGLQLTFWEHATAATGEMLDLLLFAYVVRCLLEYRSDQRESWLARSALVYGIAATDNYALIGFFPAYLAALIWLKGPPFFEFRFIARMFGWGAAGLTLYLLLPLFNAWSAQMGVGFWQALRMELSAQKNALLFPGFRFIAFLAGLTSLLPALLISIRWPSTFGDTSAAGLIVSNFVFRVMHAVFLAAGAWVALDAPFGARSQIERKIIQFADDAWGGVPFLSFYYLGALCLGYFVGYFLLVCGPEPARTRQRAPGGTALLNPVILGAVWLTIVGLPVALCYRNLPLIRNNDGLLLRDFARDVTRDLTPSRSVAFSDDPFILSLAATQLTQTGAGGEIPLADTRLMPSAAYQQSMHRRYPRCWREPPPPENATDSLNPLYLIYHLSSLVQSNEVHYLHPSFGYYFEAVYLRPRGITYRLNLYATNAVAPPALTDAEIGENQKFWADARPGLDRVVFLIDRRVADARVVGRWYSRAANWWGVELQKLGRRDEAGAAFALARKLNQANICAEINSRLNQWLRSGGAKPAEADKPLEEKFDRYRTWNALLAANGPIDEPGVRLRLGQTFLSQSLFRQAALQFLRVLELEPDNLEARLWLANAFLGGDSPDKALEVAGQIRARQPAHPLNTTNLTELIRIEATAAFNQGDRDTAERILLDARRQQPQNEALNETLIQFYLQANRLTNALAVLEEELKPKPDNIAALLNKAYVCMKLQDYDRAGGAVDAVLKKDPNNTQALLDRGAICIQSKSYKDALAPLNQVLKAEPNNDLALMNRAIALLQSDQLDAAQRDYETLQKRVPTLYSVQYGLGEIAFRRKDVPAAIKHYEAYLKYAPTNSAEGKTIADRLAQLKASAVR